MSERLFTDEELEAMSRRTLDRLTDAIEAGDREEALRAARRMFNEFESMHRLYRRWITATLSFIGRRFGHDVLEEAMADGVRAWWVPHLRALVEGTQDFRQRVRRFASGLRGHLVGLEVLEDDDRVEIRMSPCGSGGRLLMEGAYGPPDDFLSLPASPRLTYGLPDCPVYCAHQPMMELLSVEEYASPCVIVEPAAYCTTERSGDAGAVTAADRHCAFLLYKDPARIPPRYAERLGLPAFGAAGEPGAGEAGGTRR